jgi:Fe-S cluster biogenesis protein NfuA
METNTKAPTLMEQVEIALKTIRPYLEADGGDVKVVSIDEDYVVHLELLGACGTCPMSAMTLKAGVEEAIRRYVPQITGVKATNVVA